MDVGFVGLGVMGRPMAGHILDRTVHTGGTLTIWGRNRDRHSDLIDAGARWAETPAELAAVTDLIVFIVPTMADIQQVLDGPDGVLAGVTKPLTVVISSTCSAQDVRDLAPRLAEASDGLVSVVDAPVSGGAEGAVSGTLSIMVGGEAETVGPVLEALGPAGRAVHLGPVGAGQVAKACNQLIVAAEVVALAEASVIAERAGLDVAKMFDLLSTGYAGSRLMEVKAHRFATKDHSPSGPAKFMIKDLRAVAEEADRSGVRPFTLDVLRGVFSDLTAAGYGDLDTSVVQRFLEDRSALP